VSDAVQLSPLAVRSACVARIQAYAELAKPRIMVLVLIVTAVGFVLASPAEPGWSANPLLVHVLLGTALIAGGANALNQYRETAYDAQMLRSQGRPLPSGRISQAEGLAFGVLVSITGFIYLALQTNPWCAGFAGVTLLTYVLVYTPLKRVTPLCVYVGAVPGALPPVIGWAGAAGAPTIDAWILFAVLFFWQLPHFAAIAWQYRDDYARAGFSMLSVVDPMGWRTNLHVVTHSVGLIGASLLPVWAGMSGPIYAISAMLLGTVFLLVGLYFLRQKTPAVARLHVLASLAYLPVLFGLMMIDRPPV